MGTTKKYKILAFDPGIGNTGWSLLEGNTANGSLIVLKVGEFHPGPTSGLARYRDDVEKFDKRTISLTLLIEEETKLLETYRPDFVCCEDIYISMMHPQAYGSLAMWVCTTNGRWSLWCSASLSRPSPVWCPPCSSEHSSMTMCCP